jgi:hypothetical protein
MAKPDCIKSYGKIILLEIFPIKVTQPPWSSDIILEMMDLALHQGFMFDD